MAHPKDIYKAFANSVKRHKEFGMFTGSLAIGNIVSLICGVLALRWVSPESMGVWQIISVVGSYFIVVRTGIINGMNRELPYFLGKGERDFAYRLAATTQAHTLVGSALIFIGFAVALYLVWDKGVAWRMATMTMMITAPLGFYVDFLLATFRSGADFQRLSYVQFAQAGITAVLPLSTYLFGFGGYCVQAILKSIVQVSMAFYLRPIRVPPRWYKDALKKLLVTGLPLWVSSYLQTLSHGFDRIILVHRAGTTVAGYYALSTVILSSFSIVHVAVNTFIYPKQSFHLGKSGTYEELWKMSLKGALVSVIITIPITLGGWVISPHIVRTLFPNYLPGLEAMRISIWTSISLCLMTVITCLGSLKDFKSLYFCIISMVLLRWFVPWWLSGIMDPLKGVAIGTFMAVTISGIIAITVSFIATHKHSNLQ